MNEGVIMKRLREKFGYSQDAVAGLLSIKRELISYYETGAREVPLEVLEKLSDLFGVDLEVFFSDNVEEAVSELVFAEAFRADDLDKKDLEGIIAFRRIIKNYQRILNLEKKDA